METVLMLTNFSEASRHALLSYMKVHQQLKSTSKFGLLNVYSVPRTEQLQLLKFDDILEQYAQQELKREKTRIDAVTGLDKLDIDLITGKGDLLKVLAQLHAKRPVDLIVLGPKGSNILRQVLLGSNTSRIARLSKIPVLLIPEGVRFAKPKKIVFATDLKECRFEKHFERLAAIIRFFGAQLLILNVYKTTKPEEQIFEKPMNIHLKDIPHSFHYIQSKDTAQGMSGFLTENGADMLALIENPADLLLKLFRNSVTSQQALNAEMPLLVFHS